MRPLFSLLANRFLLQFPVRAKMAENTSFRFQVIDEFNRPCHGFRRHLDE